MEGVKHNIEKNVEQPETKTPILDVDHKSLDKLVERINNMFSDDLEGGLEKNLEKADERLDSKNEKSENEISEDKEVEFSMPSTIFESLEKLAEKLDELLGDESAEKSEKPDEKENREQSETDSAKEETHNEIIEGKVYYYDDNGKLYRVENELLPNSEYEINGYRYVTDDKGRIVSVKGKLHMKDRDGRLPIKDSIEDIGKGDEKEGDDRGHLIGDQFDGSNGLENMIPQDADINRNDFRKFEGELAQAVKDGKEVTVSIEPVYEGDSRRPDAIIVTYSVDGEESVRIFPNGKE